MNIEKSHRSVEGETFGDKPDTSHITTQPVNDPNKNIPDMKKPFNKTAFGRTIAGRNKTGRIIYSIIDVLPIPNIHEVVKAVIKDEELEGQILTTWDLLKQTFSRLDALRTIVGVIAALLLVWGAEWVGVEPSVIIEILKEIITIIGI